MAFESAPFALILVGLVSAVSLIGGSLLFFKLRIEHLMSQLVSFAGGTLLGASFFGLMPEGAVLAGENVWTYLALGMTSFFVIEFIFHWHHHGRNENVHPMTYLNLFGDAVHNFVDGMVIVSTFALDFSLGLVTTAAVIAHEIPQELSDFAILIHGGFSRLQALRWNLYSAVSAVVGGITAIFLTSAVVAFPAFLVPYTAGAFIYIGGVDLLPEIHRNPGRRPVLAPILLLVALSMMWILSLYLSEPT